LQTLLIFTSLKSCTFISLTSGPKLSLHFWLKRTDLICSSGANILRFICPLHVRTSVH